MSSYTGGHIAVFLPNLTGGGAERVAVDLVNRFAAKGEVVDLITAKATGPLLLDVRSDVKLTDLHRGRVATAYLPLLKHLLRTRPRALLATLEHANVLAGWVAAVRPRLRLVLREANTLSRDLAPNNSRNRLLLSAMRSAYRRADAIIAVSAGVAGDLSAVLGVPPEKIHVIANPVLTPRVAQGAAEPPSHPFFAPGAPPVVLGVGRLAAQKRFDVLLEAVARVRRRRVCRVLILGEGEARPELERRIEELGLQQEADLPGFSPNPFSAMAAAGVFVLSSAWEGLPNVLIQAMSLGTPAVATDCRSGPAEITDHGQLARLVPVDDVAAMAAAIESALDEPRQLPSADWLARYDEDLVVDRYLQLLSARDDARASTRRGVPGSDSG